MVEREPLRLVVLRAAGLRVVVDLRAVPPVELPDAEDARPEVLRDDAREPVEPVEDDFAALARLVPPLLLRVPLLLREPPLLLLREDAERRAVEPEDELELPLSSSAHLPDITRCAASATASAISEPRRDALETIVRAAA